MTARDEYNLQGSDKKGSCTHTKKQNNNFFHQVVGSNIFPFFAPFSGSDIKEDNDQDGEIDGENEQASGISTKSKPFTVNENKRETTL